VSDTQFLASFVSTRYARAASFVWFGCGVAVTVSLWWSCGPEE
jgi:hypothetical protein